MNTLNTFRGHPVMDRPMAGLVALTKPFRPGVEDMMLCRLINDCLVHRVAFVLVWEQAARAEGGWMGISVWKQAPIPPKESQPIDHRAKVARS